MYILCCILWLLISHHIPFLEQGRAQIRKKLINEGTSGIVVIILSKSGSSASQSSSGKPTTDENKPTRMQEILELEMGKPPWWCGRHLREEGIFSEMALLLFCAEVKKWMK